MYEVSPQTETTPLESSVVVVGLTNVTEADDPSVTALEKGLEESAPETVSVFTVVVRQGLAIVIVNSTLSDESDGANEVAPEDPLLVIEIVFYTLTV